MKYKSYEDFALNEFRELLGVPGNKLLGFRDFNAWAIKPALEEVNFLSDYNVTIEPLKKGRTVIKVRLAWTTKQQSKLENVHRELAHSHVGRRARMTGNTETLSNDGGLKKSKVFIDLETMEKAKELVYKAGTGWDIYAIEQQFYEYIRTKSKPD